MHVNNIKANKYMNSEISCLAEIHVSEGRTNPKDIHKRVSKLLEESGELAQAINKDMSVELIKKELGDVINTCIAVAETYQFTLNECVCMVVDDLNKRKKMECKNESK